jgi:hypothetical protein
MKRILIVSLFFLACGDEKAKSGTKDPGVWDMRCKPVEADGHQLSRCENTEVICYIEPGIWCRKKFE